jgi:leucyl-tRNA synthetase
MDTFIQSSWYFLRYATKQEDSKNIIFNKEDIDYWLEVDQYIGGIEHAILHLLYARFFTKVLRDLDYINIKEPFSNLLTQGMVLKNGTKMSKSKGNIVQPNDIIKNYGCDSARLFTLFAAPPTKELEWNDNAVDGCYKFLKRFYTKSFLCNTNFDINKKIDKLSLNKKENIARKKIYQTLLKSEDVYNKTFTFNTLIASCMETLNALSEQDNKDIYAEGFYVMCKVLEPMVPHISSEISKRLFNLENINKDISIDKDSLEDTTIQLAITVNGKKRDIIEVPKDMKKDEILIIAKDKVKKWINNNTIVKEIYVPHKLINIVIKI